MCISDLIDFILIDKQSAYIRCKSKGLLDQVLELTSFLNLHYDPIPWKQRFRHILDQTFELQLCIICKKPNKLGYSDMYNKTCSKECNKIYCKNLFKKKYGVDNYSKTKEFKEKLVSSNNSNFGVDNPMQSSDIQKKHKRNYVKKVQEKLGNEYELIHYGKMLKFIHKKCGNETEILRDTFNKRHNIYKTTQCVHCNPLNSTSSESEKDVMLFIKSRYNGTIKTHVRNMIYPYELDIYIPELKLGIEFNGDYYHTTKHVDKNYHKMKSDLCDKKGIRLLHIWEHKWIDNNKMVCDIIQSIITKTNFLDRLPIGMTTELCKTLVNYQTEGFRFDIDSMTCFVDRDYYFIKRLIDCGFKHINTQLNYWYCKNSRDVLSKDIEPNVPSGYHKCFNSGVYELVWNK